MFPYLLHTETNVDDVRMSGLIVHRIWHSMRYLDHLRILCLVQGQFEMFQYLFIAAIMVHIEYIRWLAQLVHVPVSITVLYALCITLLTKIINTVTHLGEKKAECGVYNRFYNRTNYTDNLNYKAALVVQSWPLWKGYNTDKSEVNQKTDLKYFCAASLDSSYQTLARESISFSLKEGVEKT